MPWYRVGMSRTTHSAPQDAARACYHCVTGTLHVRPHCSCRDGAVYVHGSGWGSCPACDAYADQCHAHLPQISLTQMLDLIEAGQR
jgi:hypothetical protein